MTPSHCLRWPCALTVGRKCFPIGPARVVATIEVARWLNGKRRRKGAVTFPDGKAGWKIHPFGCPTPVA